METTIDTKSTITLLIEQIPNNETLFFDIATVIGYALSPAMNKSLHAAFVKICTILFVQCFTARKTASLLGKSPTSAPEIVGQRNKTESVK